MNFFLANVDFSVDFSLTYNLLTVVASFRIGVPSILFVKVGGSSQRETCK